MNTSQQAIAYYEAIRAGYSPQEAFKMAFPNGLPTQEDRLKEAAKAQQQAGYGQLGGIVAGLLGTKAVADVVSGKPILGGIFGSGGSAAATGAASSGSAVAGATGSGGVGTAFGGGGHLAAPEIVSASPTTSGAGAGGLSLAGTVPYAGAAIGAYLVKEGLEDLAAGKDDRSAKGLASRVQTGITTGYLSEAARALGIFDHETTDEERARRYDALKEAGVLTHWDQGGGDPYARGGQFRDNLAADFIGNDSEGNWVNNKFAQSRDVNDLRAEDIWGHSAFYEKFGNDWLQSFNEDQRRKIAQGLLDQGAISEGRGQIEINTEIDPTLARQMFLGEQPQRDIPRSEPAPIGNDLAASLGFSPNNPAQALGSPPPGRQPLTEQELKQLDQFGSKLVGALY